VKLLMVLAYLGAVFLFGGTVRTLARWSDIGNRPVLTCGELAGAEPGTPVLLVGRTAAGPVLTVRHGSEPCVGYLSVRTHHRVISDNYEETTTDAGPDSGDVTLHGDGTRVFLAQRIRTDRLTMGPAMMTLARTIEDYHYTQSEQRTEQVYVVPPERPVVAAGTVAVNDSGEAYLEWSQWTDGSMQGDADGVSRAFALDFALLLGVTLAVAAAAILLTYLVVR
jgi:hypothetical protein